MRSVPIAATGLLVCVVLLPAAASGEEPERLVDLAVALSRANDWPAAREAWLEAARRLDKDSGGTRAAYRAAAIAYDRLGEREIALAELRRFLETHPGAPQASRALRRLALEVPEGPPRIAFYATAYRALQNSPLGPEIAYRCGRHAEESALLVAAVHCYHRVVTHHPTHPHAGDARFRLGGLLGDLGRHDAAIRVYRGILIEPASARRPLDRRDRALGPGLPVRLGARHGPRVWLALGEALLETGETRAAEAAFTALLHYHPDHTRLRAEALRHLAHLKAARGDVAGARRSWRRLLEEAPGSRYAPEAEAALR